MVFATIYWFLVIFAWACNFCPLLGDFSLSSWFQVYCLGDPIVHVVCFRATKVLDTIVVFHCFIYLSIYLLSIVTLSIRLRFGSNNLYIFRKPTSSTSKKRRSKEMSYEDAQEEILKHSGLYIIHGLLSYSLQLLVINNAAMKI